MRRLLMKNGSAPVPPRVSRSIPLIRARVPPSVPQIYPQETEERAPIPSRSIPLIMVIPMIYAPPPPPPIAPPPPLAPLAPPPPLPITSYSEALNSHVRLASPSVSTPAAKEKLPERLHAKGNFKLAILYGRSFPDEKDGGYIHGVFEGDDMRATVSTDSAEELDEFFVHIVELRKRWMDLQCQYRLASKDFKKLTVLEKEYFKKKQLESDIRFWKTEWESHGKYFGMSLENFFEMVILLYDKLNPNRDLVPINLGLTPGSFMKASKLQKIIKNKIHVDTQICVVVRGSWW